MKRHNLQPSFRESSDSLRQQAASTNLPMPATPASGNGVYAWTLGDTLRFVVLGAPWFSFTVTAMRTYVGLECQLEMESGRR